MATTTVNDALVELDKVIEATNYLLEELKTRKDKFLNEGLINEVKAQMETDKFKSDLYSYIQNYYGSGLCREVAFHVMEKINESIDKFITDRVNTALANAMEYTNR